MNYFEYMSNYIKSGSSGGSGVDDGFCIAWDGNTEGREHFDVMGVFNYYKCSNLVVDDLNGYNAVSDNFYVHPGTANRVASGNGWAALTDSNQPLVISGVAGSHTYGDITIQIPSDGTYFLKTQASFIQMLYKPTTV